MYAREMPVSATFVRRAAAMSAGLATWALVATAAATVVLALDRESLVRGADAIVAGRVRTVQAVAGPDGGPAILTRVEIDVHQTYKALPEGPSDRLTLLQTGGTLGHRTLQVHGQARFSAGEPVLLFVERLSDGRLMPYGMAQGKFTLTEQGGRTLAVRDLADLSLAVRGPSGRLTFRTDDRQFPVRFDLSELEALIVRYADPAADASPTLELRDVR